MREHGGLQNTTPCTLGTSLAAVLVARASCDKLSPCASSMAPKKKASSPTNEPAVEAAPGQEDEAEELSPLVRVRAEVTSLLVKGGAVSEEDRNAAQRLMDIWCAASGPMDEATFAVLSKVYGAKPPVKKMPVKKTRLRRFGL